MVSLSLITYTSVFGIRLNLIDDPASERLQKKWMVQQEKYDAHIYVSDHNRKLASLKRHDD
jgi:hypothetical protein